MKCLNCGMENSVDSRFCVGCGSLIHNVQQPVKINNEGLFIGLCVTLAIGIPFMFGFISGIVKGISENSNEDIDNNNTTISESVNK